MCQLPTCLTLSFQNLRFVAGYRTRQSWGEKWSREKEGKQNEVWQIKISKGSHFDMSSNGVLRGKVVRKVAAACQTVWFKIQTHGPARFSRFGKSSNAKVKMMLILPLTQRYTTKIVSNKCKANICRVEALSSPLLPASFPQKLRHGLSYRFHLLEESQPLCISDHKI